MSVDQVQQATVTWYVLDARTSSATLCTIGDTDEIHSGGVREGVRN